MSLHATAVIDPDARLGAGVRVGPFAVIEDDVVIGDRSEIRAHAVVKRYTTLGADNVVHEGAILGGEPQDVSYVEARTELRVGNGNRIREGVTLHRGSKPGSATVVGDECFLMAYVHVAHDDQIGDRVIIANNVVRLYDDHQRRRLLARPGVTGLAQVSGRNAIPWSERIEIDVGYVNRWSMRRDLAILARTARVVARREGTYKGERGGFDLPGPGGADG